MKPIARSEDRLDADRLLRLLGPWQLHSAWVGEELTIRGDRSRAWLIREGDQKYVAKVTFDGPMYVEPGLRIAAAVDAAGISTGPPILTAAGDLCSPIQRQLGRPWTIALLTWVSGCPIDPCAPSIAREAGQLLGRVHQALASHEASRTAGNLLTFYRAEASRLGGSVGAGLERAVDQVQDAADRGHLQCGVLYGDPSPEILQHPQTGELALIDWGTPSWGPLLFDVLTWERFFENASAEGERSSEVRSGYLQICPARSDELAWSAMVTGLIDAVRGTWI